MNEEAFADAAHPRRACCETCRRDAPVARKSSVLWSSIWRRRPRTTSRERSSSSTAASRRREEPVRAAVLTGPRTFRLETVRDPAVGAGRGAGPRRGRGDLRHRLQDLERGPPGPLPAGARARVHRGRRGRRERASRGWPPVTVSPSSRTGAAARATSAAEAAGTSAWLGPRSGSTATAASPSWRSSRSGPAGRRRRRSPRTCSSSPSRSRSWRGPWAGRRRDRARPRPSSERGRSAFSPSSSCAREAAGSWSSGARIGGSASRAIWAPTPPSRERETASRTRRGICRGATASIS